ncbi:VOC family protein [Parahaliea aestuarii]|uniref:VOC domain-containing protein n=1 Tax=Parahaliea aestuarii TaxID=1852021 RepID=A0A5C8ZSX6_9GAMM|nr:VOC family protein [Parahaliea aestuarii]TXS91613.1 hypothetical protein FVW59_10625 [Parahaliea aestuarii]
MISSMGYVFIAARDPQQWLSYGTEVLGMMQAPGMPAGDSVYLKIDERPFRFAVVPGEEDHLLCCGLEVRDGAALDQLCKRLEEAGVAFAWGSAAEAGERCVRRFIRCSDPSGNRLEIYCGATLDYLKFVSPQGIAGFETGCNGSAGFGHAVLPASKLEETHAFYTELLGMGDTDYMNFRFSEDPADPGLGLYFLHADNPRHHSLALFECENAAGCIHLMLEVSTVDEVGYCLDRVLARDIPVTSTLGRHTNDRMLSFYMMTPGGFPLEFGCQGLQMDWSDYTPTVSATPSLWGHKFAL